MQEVVHHAGSGAPQWRLVDRVLVEVVLLALPLAGAGEAVAGGVGEVLQGRGEDRLDLAVLGDGRPRSGDDADEGGDEEAAGHGYRQQSPEDLDLGAGQGDLLLGLAQGGLQQVAVGGLGLAAGERELTSVRAHVAGALDEQEAGRVGGREARQQRGQHGGVTERRGIGHGRVDGFEAKAEVAWDLHGADDGTGPRAGPTRGYVATSAGSRPGRRADELPALDHQRGALQRVDVGERVAVDDHEIGDGLTHNGAMQRRFVMASILLVACTDRPSADATGDTDAASTTGQPTSDSTPTSSATNEPDSTGDASSGGPVSGSSGDDSTGSGPTGTTGTTGETTGEDPGTTTDEPGACARSCARFKTHEGDLLLGPGSNTNAFECVTRITGQLWIDGDVDATALAGLADLAIVDDLLSISGNAVLTDLAAFACLREARAGVLLNDLPALTDTSALAGLRVAPNFALRFTGVTALHAAGPEFMGTSKIDLTSNPALVDLKGLASWTVAQQFLVLVIDDSEALTDLTGLDGLISGADQADTLVITLSRLPALPSLAGLEPLTRGTLGLTELPLITDLQPLSKLTQAGGLVLAGMPLVTSLGGLAQLESAGTLAIGECIGGGPDTPGMDGLTSLAGLESLTSVSGLGVANNAQLVSLAGAPKLHTVTAMEVIANPKLSQAAVDAFTAQLDMGPQDACVGGWDECSCFEALPW